VKIRPDIAGGSTFGSNINLYGPNSTNIIFNGIAINQSNDDIHAIYTGVSNNTQYHRRVDGSTDSPGTQTTDTVTGSNGHGQVVNYAGWMYRQWMDGSDLVHVNRAKLAESPTWTDTTVSSAAMYDGTLFHWWGLRVGNGQLVLSWARASDREIMWSQGPFFNFENTTGVQTASTWHWTPMLIRAEDDELHLIGTEQDQNASVEVAATFRNLNIRYAAGENGDLYWDQGASGFPDDRSPIVPSQHHAFELPESSTVPRVFHQGFVQGLDLGGSGDFYYYWWISLDGLYWFQSPAAGNSWNQTHGNVVFDGTIAHVSGSSLASDSTTEDGEVVYGQYDPVDEEWDVSQQLVANTYEGGVSRIAVRSDNTVVAAYVDASSGNTLANLRYKIRSSGGTWGGENTVQAGDSGQGVQYLDIVLGASDRTHILWGDSGSNNLYHRSLSSGDSLDTASTVDSTYRVVEGALYDGTDIGVVYVNGTRQRGFRSATSEADPSWSDEQDVDDSSWSDLDGFTDYNKCFYLVEHPTESGSWFAVTMPRNTVPHDFYIDQRTSDWSTDYDSGVNSMSASGGQHDPSLFYGNLSYVEGSTTYMVVLERGGTNGPELTDASIRLTRIPISVNIGEPELLVEVASESDTATEATLVAEPNFGAEQASESDVAYEVLIGFETGIIPEQASESDVAYEAEISVNAPSLDASTDITFTIDLTAGVAENVAVVPPTPIVGQGTVKRGDHRTKVYRPDHNVIRRR
jgi:hypothetical protein